MLHGKRSWRPSSVVEDGVNPHNIIKLLWELLLLGSGFFCLLWILNVYRGATDHVLFHFGSVDDHTFSWTFSWGILLGD